VHSDYPVRTCHDENVKHWSELLDADDATYPNDDELMTISSRFSDAFRLFRFGVGHHVLKPGRRTSYPHAELAEEEFVYVLEGTPDLWQDGHLHRLQPGDGVGWPSGTGIAHCLINNTDSDVRLLVVGEPSRRRYGVHYPLHPSRNAELGEQWWHDAPKRELGPHDGLPDARREKLKKGP
jgi:uncharacterized cupin superfamily protein